MTIQRQGSDDQILFRGSDSLHQINRILITEKVERVLLVTGKASFISCGAQALLWPYLSKLECLHFDDFEVNPKIEDVYKALKLLDNFKPDFVVAVGGGSVLDMAKLLCLLANQPKEDIENIIVNQQQAIPKSFTLLAIPTTSGTGSEATHFAVVYINGQKYSLAHALIRPRYVILAAQLTRKLPPKIMAVTAFDALSQAVESFWAVGANSESRDYAVKAIKLVFSNIVGAVNSPDDRQLEEVMLGAYYAGKAINISKTTAPHALSYILTSHFGIAHGHAVALSLGKILLLNTQVTKIEQINGDRELHSFQELMAQLILLLGGGSAQQCCDRLYQIMNKIGLETSLQALGLASTKNIEHLVDNINLERMSNHPIKLSKQAVADIWRAR